jgi:hypothetical protein
MVAQSSGVTRGGYEDSWLRTSPHTHAGRLARRMLLLDETRSVGRAAVFMPKSACQRRRHPRGRGTPDGMRSSSERAWAPRRRSPLPLPHTARALAVNKGSHCFDQRARAQPESRARVATRQPRGRVEARRPPSYRAVVDEGQSVGAGKAAAARAPPPTRHRGQGAAHRRCSCLEGAVNRRPVVASLWRCKFAAAEVPDSVGF